MKKILLILAALVLGGCVNLYTRAPWTDVRIESVYQCSRAAAGMSVIVAFPQMMSDAPNHELMIENIFTIPLGCVCMCDAACEAVIDTVCLPFDWPISASRKKKDLSKTKKEE